jgi:alkylation response protein AidB-like acyl-CoA dehydrogenase
MLFRLPLHRRVSHLLSGTWDLSSDELQLHDVALKFSDKELSPKAGAWDLASHFPRDVIQQTAGLGFGGLYCSPEHGGSGLSRLETSLVFEALAKGCVSFATYLSVHNMAAWILDTFASPALKSHYLPKMCALELFGAYCLTEPDSGSDAKMMKTAAKLDGDYYVINGAKMFITGGAASDVMVVMCKTAENEVSSFLVEKKFGGVHFGKNEEKLGWKMHPTNLVTFENVRVPKENLIGKLGGGYKIALQGLGGGRINIASISLGGAWFALEKARDYMEQRKQFGQTISEFQYPRFVMAEEYAKLTSARVLVRHAARLLDSNNASKITVGAMAKLQATDICFEIVDKALQMHGGMGVIHSTGIERVFRDLRINKIVEGTNEIMKLLIARELFPNTN